MDRLDALRQQRLWWTGALVVALAIVGHDAMMAGNAHAAGHGDVAMRGAELVRRADETQAKHRNATAVHHSSHTDGCSTIHPGVRRDDSDPAIGMADAPGTPVAESMMILRLPVAVWWREPTMSAGVRRALFQVFRI